MINQELLEDIQQRTRQGESRKDTTQALIDAGWPPEAIENAFRTIDTTSQSSIAQPIISIYKPKSNLRPVAALIAGVLVLGVGAFFLGQAMFKPMQAALLPQDATSANTPPSQQTPSKDEQTSPEIAFADKLNACEKEMMRFTHPFTRTEMEKEIQGIVDDKCVYVEEMPNNGRMECRYSESERRAVAQYYKDVAVATSIQAGISDDGQNEEPTYTYTIDGQEVDNPLQTVMNNGVCVVSGY